MSAVVWASARAAVRVHGGALAGSALVVALTAALLTATGVWFEAGVRHAGDPAGSALLAVASSFAGTAVVIALIVVASTFSAALRPRAREFAMLRAVGATAGQVRQLVAAEVLLVFAAAVPLGVLPGLWLAPRVAGTLADAGIVPAGFTTTLSPWPVVVTLALLVRRLSGRPAWPGARVRGSIPPAPRGRLRSSRRACHAAGRRPRRCSRPSACRWRPARSSCPGRQVPPGHRSRLSSWSSRPLWPGRCSSHRRRAGCSTSSVAAPAP
ncbi:ABC transporter permease [Xylanimonas sp. McL0601]|uniref:ABC transporter permease n=1 Tax=Xylanimonas sp. McL0601 TaxID=3414739 RepID=UPI003CE86347